MKSVYFSVNIFCMCACLFVIFVLSSCGIIRKSQNLLYSFLFFLRKFKNIKYLGGEQEKESNYQITLLKLLLTTRDGQKHLHIFVLTKDMEDILSPEGNHYEIMNNT